MGIIYKICSTENWGGANNIPLFTYYIGQTRRSLEIRWGEHIEAGRLFAEKQAHVPPIDKRLTPEQKHTYQILAILECPNEELDKWEQYYIEQYSKLHVLDNIRHNPHKKHPHIEFIDLEAEVQCHLTPGIEYTYKQLKDDDLSHYIWKKSDLQPFLTFKLLTKLPNNKYIVNSPPLDPSLAEEYRFQRHSFALNAIYS